MTYNALVNRFLCKLFKYKNDAGEFFPVMWWPVYIKRLSKLSYPILRDPHLLAIFNNPFTSSVEGTWWKINNPILFSVKYVFVHLHEGIMNTTRVSQQKSDWHAYSLPSGQCKLQLLLEHALHAMADKVVLFQSNLPSMPCICGNCFSPKPWVG